MFPCLPNEIILVIGNMLREGDLNALVQTSPFLYHLLNPILYQKNMHMSDGYALLWAIIYRVEQTAKKAIDTKVTDLGEALTLAASSGQSRIVEYLLLAENAVFEARFVDGWRSNKMWTSDFRTETRSSQTHKVRISDIDKEKPPWDRETINSRTPLSRASRNGHIETVKLLLSSGRSFLAAKDQENDFGYTPTPLYHALYRGHVEIARILLVSAIHDRSEVRSNLREEFKLLVQFDQVALVDLLVKSDHALLDASDDMGRTAMSWAAEHGCLSTIKYLVKSGQVNVEARDEEGRTPLSYAATDANISTVLFLLGLDGVDIESQDNEGRTPFSHAARCGNIEVVKILAASGKVAIDNPDIGGQTPTSLAFEGCGIDEQDVPLNLEGLRSVQRFFVNCGQVNLDSRDEIGRTPLSYAAGYMGGDEVELLVKSRKVEPDLADNNGETPLSYALQANNFDAAIILLQTGKVNPDARDRFGATPLSHVSEETAQWLLSEQENGTRS